MTRVKVRSGCHGSSEGWNEEGSREVEMKTAPSKKWGNPRTARHKRLRGKSTEKYNQDVILTEQVQERLAGAKRTGFLEPAGIHIFLRSTGISLEFEALGKMSRFSFNEEYQSCNDEKCQTGNRFERVVLGIRGEKLRVYTEVATM